MILNINMNLQQVLSCNTADIWGQIILCCDAEHRTPVVTSKNIYHGMKSAEEMKSTTKGKWQAECVPPANSGIEILTPNMTVWRGEAFGWGPHKWVQDPLGREPRAPSVTWGHGEKSAICTRKGRPTPQYMAPHHTVQVHNLGLPASRTVKNIYISIVYKPPIHGTLL